MSRIMTSCKDGKHGACEFTSCACDCHAGKMDALLDCLSLEDYEPHKRQAIRRVRIVESYNFDGSSRVSVRILEGPETGRVVNSLSPKNLIPLR